MNCFKYKPVIKILLSQNDKCKHFLKKLVFSVAFKEIK